MDATLSTLRAMAKRHQPQAAINDWLGVECYYSSAGYFKRKAAEALQSARILADCCRHRGEPMGSVVAANLHRAARYRRQAMEVKYGPA